MPDREQNLVRMGDMFTTKVRGCGFDSEVGEGRGFFEKFARVTPEALLEGRMSAECMCIDGDAELEVDVTASVACVEPSCEFSSVNRQR